MVRAVRLSIEAVDRRIETVVGTLGASPISVFFMVRLLLSLPGNGIAEKLHRSG